MAITLNASPNLIHSSGNTNWWVFDSTLRFAPRFNLRMDIFDQSNNLYNTVLVPTNPSNLNILDIKNIIDDYCVVDFNPTITSATANTSIKQYKMAVYESFEGFYILGTASANQVGTVSVFNNTTYQNIATPSSVFDIGFLGGSITSSLDSIYVINYGTASDGYINRFNLSRSDTQYLPLTASIGSSSPGYLVLANYPMYSIGASTSTTLTYASKAYIDYLDYNTTNNFSGYVALNSTSKFLTKAPRDGVSIQPGEYATLTFIQSTTQSVPFMYVVDNLGATYSKTISLTSSTIKCDIPSGTANLNINSNADWYEIRLQNASGSAIYSETFRYYINCLNTYWTPIRLCWFNSFGGIDYYTFKFVSNSGKKVERSTFDKNLNYGYTQQDRGISTYKLNDFDQYTCVSELVDDATSDWLQDLYTSNEVYWIRNGVLIPITLTSDTYERNVGVESKEVQVQFRLSRTNKK